MTRTPPSRSWSASGMLCVREFVSVAQPDALLDLPYARVVGAREGHLAEGQVADVQEHALHPAGVFAVGDERALFTGEDERYTPGVLLVP